MRTIDGKKKPGLLKQVLFIPVLTLNLFSIGLAYKARLSFCTIGDCCEYHDFGKGPKVMEGVRMGTLYRLSIEPVLPSGILDTIPSLSKNPSTALPVTSNLSSNLTLWHNRMAHASIQVIKMSEHGSLKKISVSPFASLPSISM